MKSRGMACALGALLLGCGSEAIPNLGPSTFHIEVTSVNGNPALPTAASPLPANRGDTFDTWGFTIEARSPTGEPDLSFNGVVRLSTRPGAIGLVTGDGAAGRNVRLKGGKGSGAVTVTAAYGPTRLWAEDLGYVPAPAGKIPACADGKNNDLEDDVLIDFPADPGCAFADDDTEQGGTYAAGVSRPVQYALPKISDLQGDAALTPYPYESIEVNTTDPEVLVVTRVSSDGFYVTDVNPTEMMNGYNSLFAFNFSTPPGMRVCDRVTYLAGTANDFFGFTELSFPSYRVDPLFEGKGICPVPEPALLTTGTIFNGVAMEKLESSLVRLKGFHIAHHFGPKLALKNVFGAPMVVSDQSSCDFNGDGQVDFMSMDEGSCSAACDSDPECSEYTSFSARGSVKVTDGNAKIVIQTGAISGFDPLGNRGKTLDSMTGTLRNFSGGTLNWTVEARCPDDLVCTGECICQGCPAAPIPSTMACVRLRSLDDNDQGTN
jgi:hypothetical protein